MTRTKWTGGVTQEVQYLLCKCKAPEFNPQSHQRGKKKKKGKEIGKKTIPPKVNNSNGHQ
jgi:hypothetical protein